MSGGEARPIDADAGAGGSGSLTSCAFVSFELVPTDGAYCVNLLEVCDAMTSAGVDTELLACPATDPPARPDALREDFGLRNAPRVRWVPQGSTRISRAYRLATESIEAGRRSDVTYSLWPLPAAFALLGGPKHAVVELHMTDMRLVDRLALSIARHSRRFRVVAISARLADLLAERYGLDRESIIVEHCGHAFPVRYDYGDDANPGRPLRAMYVGSFLPGRGLEMIAALAQRHPEVEFDLVGGEAGSIRFGENVRVHGRVPHGEVPALLSEADVLLMPYTRSVKVFGEVGGTAEYCSPLKMFEYLAAGRSIIASDLPSISEVLVDGSNALLVDPGSEDGWSAALVRLRDDPALRSRLARSAAGTAERYAISRRVERILDRLGSGS